MIVDQALEGIVHPTAVHYPHAVQRSLCILYLIVIPHWPKISTPLAIINLLDKARDGYTSHAPAGVLWHSFSFFYKRLLARPSCFPQPPNMHIQVAPIFFVVSIYNMYKHITILSGIGESATFFYGNPEAKFSE